MLAGQEAWFTLIWPDSVGFDHGLRRISQMGVFCVGLVDSQCGTVRLRAKGDGDRSVRKTTRGVRSGGRVRFPEDGQAPPGGATFLARSFFGFGSTEMIGADGPHRLPPASPSLCSEICPSIRRSYHAFWSRQDGGSSRNA